MTSKRVLLYGTNYYPEPIGIPRYTTEMAEDMVAAGFGVTVIAAGPLYPTWTRNPGYSYGRYARELFFWLASLPVLLREALLRRPDALIVTSPPLVLSTALLLPLGAARKAIIVKDLQIDIAENLGVVRSRALLGLLYRVERFLLDRAHLVTAVSLGMLKRIREKGLEGPTCEFFPDWVDTEHLSETSPEAAAAKRRELALPLDKIVVGYSGNLARKQGIELLIEIADRFRVRGKDEVHFLICGDGPAKAGLADLIVERGLANVTLVPLQPEADLPALLTAIDVHVVPQKDEVSDLVMPGKMFNIMSCSRSLVVTAPPGSAIDSVLTISGGGLRVSREDIDGLDAAIEKLCRDAPLRTEMGRKGRNYVLGHMAKRSILDVFYSRLFKK
jgi:colanic acid biosynthesis glycosyl transferase WcaI